MSFLQDLASDEPVKAHRGLLRVARRMLPKILPQILLCLQTLTSIPKSSRAPPTLLFTGHSAGGGVAALICAHIRRHCPEIVRSFASIHCITFAAPPVLAPLEAVSTAPNPSESLTINVVNHGDIVPRAEKNYIRSLLQLYRERAEHISADRWDFGQPTTFNYGQIVILKDVCPENEEPRMHAYRSSQGLWQTMAFGSIRAHPMNVYVQAVDGFVALHHS